MEIVEACRTGQFPSIENVCKYGLGGYLGTNPLAVFECYKHAIKKGVTGEQLQDAMERGTLNEIVMKSPGIEKNMYYLPVLKQGGIKVPPQSFECVNCGFFSYSKSSCNCT